MGFARDQLVNEWLRFSTTSNSKCHDKAMLTPWGRVTHTHIYIYIYRLVMTMTCRLIRIKPLCKPMLDYSYCQLGSWEYISAKFELKFNNFLRKKKNMKTPSAKLQPICLGLNVSSHTQRIQKRHKRSRFRHMSGHMSPVHYWNIFFNCHHYLIWHLSNWWHFASVMSCHTLRT